MKPMPSAYSVVVPVAILATVNNAPGRVCAMPAPIMAHAVVPFVRKTARRAGCRAVCSGQRRPAHAVSGAVAGVRQADFALRELFTPRAHC